MQNTSPTHVTFYMEGREPLAVLTKSRAPFNGYRRDNTLCYSHNGQHSQCHRDYLKRLPLAKPGQYEDLQRELEAMGYSLAIDNRNTP